MWDFDLQRQTGNFAAEIYEMLGLPAGSRVAVAGLLERPRPPR